MNTIRFTPLDSDGQPTGEPITTEGKAAICADWENSELARYGQAINRNWIDGLKAGFEEDITSHCAGSSPNHWTHYGPLGPITFDLKPPDEPLHEQRERNRNLAVALDIPPALLGVPVTSRPIPSPAAGGYQRRIKARRRRNRK